MIQRLELMPCSEKFQQLNLFSVIKIRLGGDWIAGCKVPPWYLRVLYASLQKSKAWEQTGNIHSVNKVKASQNQCNYHWDEVPRKRVDSQGWMSLWKYCFSQTQVIWLHIGVAGWNLRTCDIQEIRLDDLMVPADHKLSESMQTRQRALSWDIKFTFDTKLFTNWLWCCRSFRIQAQLFKAASG